jgi:hypothetical protein
MATDLNVAIAKELVACMISTYNSNYALSNPGIPKSDNRVFPNQIKTEKLEGMIELSFGAWTCFMSGNTGRIYRMRQYLAAEKTKIEHWGDQERMAYILVKR